MATTKSTTTAEEEQLLLGTRRLHVACVGGGQLGRMMGLEAPRLNVRMSFLDAGGLACPAAQVTSSDGIVQGGLKDAAAIQALAALDDVDVVTVEIEHVNVDALQALEDEAAGKIRVRPAPRVLRTIQDKLVQKEHFARSGIPLPSFRATPSVDAIREACRVLGTPLMLKSRRGGYDGRGNAVLQSPDGIADALQKLGVPDPAATDLDLYAEGWIHFTHEIAVVVVRSAAPGTPVATYPAVNAIQQNSICRLVLAPAREISKQLREECRRVAQQAVQSLGEGAYGVFGVELFVAPDGRVLLNEVAPRPHNTGHYTQDACSVSQFENHLRAVCGMPLGSTEMLVDAAAMVNVLGAPSGTVEDTLLSSQAAMKQKRAVVHWYGKQGCRVGRKMGHINVTGNSTAEVDTALGELLALEGIPVSLMPSGKLLSSPEVGVIMGSQSDLPTMKAALDMLKKFGVHYEVDIVSAHRTPDKLMEYSRSAENRGLRVIIAGAGGAAHLPGMVAAMTPLPVVGVPVKTSTLSGVDSLYSIVQMPRGVPVATVAIGNAMNAGLLAVRIMSVLRPELRRQMAEYQEEMKSMVDGMSAKLQDMGSEDFLQHMENKSTAVNV